MKCPYDKISHNIAPENLPVNYSVLTALPMGAQNQAAQEGGVDSQGNQVSAIKFCDVHP